MEKYNKDEFTEEETLQPGITATGVVVGLTTGKVSEFVKNTVEWEGSQEVPCINMKVEVLYKDRSYFVEECFTFKMAADGGKLIPASGKSNLRRFFRHYRSKPYLWQKVECTTNADGYFRIQYR